jgi:spectinomycin phosphotransferase
MLEKPTLQDERLIDCLREHYELPVSAVAFLPLGADRNTAVYRATLADGTPYFVKLRRGDFDETTVLVPHLLHAQGIRQIIGPLAARSGAVWVPLDEYKLTVSPFVEGRDAYEIDLADHHWIEFGQALQGLHAAVLPLDLRARLPQETYSPQWREIVKGFQAQVETVPFADPVAVELAAFMRLKRDEISALVTRAESLAAVLRTRSLPLTLCHADIHAGNLLITAHGDLYVVDWDTLILAPKERDLMFVGGGLFRDTRTAEEEETLFYEGYGPTAVDLVALAYYRYERIVQDIAAYGEQILATEEGGADRANGLQQLTSQFQPGGVVGFAHQTGKNLPPEIMRFSNY